jgi:hypothetical protein
MARKSALHEVVGVDDVTRAFLVTTEEPEMPSMVRGWPKSMLHDAGNSANNKHRLIGESRNGAVQAFAVEGNATTEDEMSEEEKVNEIEAAAEASAAAAIAASDTNNKLDTAVSITSQQEDAGNTTADKDEVASVQENATMVEALEQCQMRLLGLKNATAILTAKIGGCDSNLRSENITMNVEIARASEATELRRTKMEELKAQVEEEQKAHHMLQTAREDRAAFTKQCHVMTSNTKAAHAAKIEEYTQKIKSLQSQHSIQELSAVTQAKQDAETLAKAERDKVEAARVQAKQEIADATESANLAIKTRRMELLATQKDSLAVVVEAVRMNQTRIQDEAKVAREEAMADCKQSVSRADSEAHKARLQLMKMQWRLDAAEKKYIATTGAVQKLHQETRHYREWADQLVAKLQESVRKITDKSEDAVQAVKQISATLSAMVHETGASTYDQDPAEVQNFNSTTDNDDTQLN